MSLTAAVSLAVAGVLAEKAFGFTHLSKAHHASPGQALSPAGAAHLARVHAGNVASARALESGLLYVTLAPMVRTHTYNLVTSNLLQSPA